MPNFILALLLSLGTGAVYALLAQGIVAIYKGSGVLNFAQGAVAMFSTYVFVELTGAGMNRYLAIILVVLGSAIAGAIVSVGIFRPLRTAPPLAKAVAALGLLVGFQGIVVIIWGTGAQIVPSLFPTRGIKLTDVAYIGEDRLWMAGTALVVAALLWAAFKFTRLGLATQAASENERGASLLGYSPTVIAALNWALGFALAALGGAMIASITTLDSASMPLLVLPAMAAALIGRFASFWGATLAAFGIGWVEVWVFREWTQPGVQTAAPFVVVILVMVIVGRALPTRGAVSEGRPPLAPIGLARWLSVPLVVGAAAVMLATFDATYQSALTTTMTMAIIALSLVVVTGYSGQISLMQMTFAGLGGLITAKVASNWGVPFPLSILLAAAIVAPMGALLGAPALRVRGLSLAIVTLAASISVDAVFFQNAGWGGGQDGVPVPSPSLVGISLDPFAHPARYGTFVLVMLVLVALLVGNLRRSGLGRQMLAVRSNERAAAVAGVDVAAVKLQAFTISSIVAAIGGGVLAYANQFFLVATGDFGASPSINLVTIAYIGGIASVGGGVIAGLIAAGGIVYVLLSSIGGFTDYYLLFTGVGLVWTVMAHPDGVAPFFGEKLARLGLPTRKHEVAPEPPEPGSGMITEPTQTRVQMP